jgi:hypothetical protein
MHTLLLSDSYVAVAIDEGDGSLLLQQKQTELRMDAERERERGGESTAMIAEH